MTKLIERLTQDTMDELFGVGESSASGARPIRSSGNVEQMPAALRRAAMQEAERLFPGDGIAAHRAAARLTRAADASKPDAAEAPASSADTDQQTIDRALLNAFGKLSGGQDVTRSDR